MKKQFFYGKSATENGKQKEYIEIIRTKIGNRYIALVDGENAHYVPYDCLVCFAEQFEPTNLEQANKEAENLRKLAKEMEEWLAEKERERRERRGE